MSAASIAFTAGSISAGACAARRSSRRTAVASGGTGECRPADGLVRGAQIVGDFFRLHHDGAALGERGLLAGLRTEPAEFVDGMAQPFGFAAGTLDRGAVALDRGFARAPLGP